MRRGLEPVIATIIIIAITLGIAIAFIGWMWGFWGTHSTVHAEALQFYSDSYFSGSDIYLHVKTHLNPEARFKVSVPGYGINSIEVYKVEAGQVRVDNGVIIAKVGSDFWIKISLDRPISSSEIRIKIYSDLGYLYWYSIRG